MRKKFLLLFLSFVPINTTAYATDAHMPSETLFNKQDTSKVQSSINKGLKWLVSQQDIDGTWMKPIKTGPTDRNTKEVSISVAVTALIAKSLIQKQSTNDKMIKSKNNAIKAINKKILEEPAKNIVPLETYILSTAISALSAIESPSEHDLFVLNMALNRLRDSQWIEKNKNLATIKGLQTDKKNYFSVDNEDNLWNGGFGYGTRKRPDLSNTQIALQAFHDAKISSDDPVFQRAINFLTKTQNLKYKNSLPWVNDDGGFIYTPANGGESLSSEFIGEGRHGEKMPENMDRTLRSYGSMTYAGYKSLLYAGLSKEDLRVKEALKWISQHWTMEENPGLGQQGYYYYIHAMSRALTASNLEQIIDKDQIPRQWKQELTQAILKRQRSKGYWVNDSGRWLEGHPELSTAYAILALQEAIK